MTAVAVLALAPAPDVTHYFPFLGPLAAGHDLGAGIATGLAAAVAASLFITVALSAVHCRFIFDHSRESVLKLVYFQIADN